MNVQQLQRDLQWLVHSPSLITSDLCEFDGNDASLTDDVDVDHLSRFIDERQTHRVGQYFENLFQYWREHLLGEKLVLHGQRIYRDSQTLGEIDFVFQSHEGMTIHWETAVKFFLYSEQPHSTGSHWIGPNSRDTFERKTNRLFDHQLQMGKHLDFEIDVAHPFVKGRLYDHPFVERPTSLPVRANPAHLSGIWIYGRQTEWLENRAERFQILSKPYWLSDVRIVGAVEPKTTWTYPELDRFVSEHFQTSTRPLHIAMLNQIETGWIESERLFIVDEDWPAESR